MKHTPIPDRSKQTSSEIRRICTESRAETFPKDPDYEEWLAEREPEEVE